MLDDIKDGKSGKELHEDAFGRTLKTTNGILLSTRKSLIDLILTLAIVILTKF